MLMFTNARRARTTNPLLVLIPAAVGVCVGLGGSRAWGQNALGDGRALDRNLQVGSGGKLPGGGGGRRDAFAEQMRFNNAVINGTATGGKAFRGFAPSAAFDRLQTSAGSDDLYTFRRDSNASAISGLGIRGTDALRYQFALTTGAGGGPGISGATQAMGSLAAAGGTLQRSSDVTSSGSSTALRSTAQYVSTRSLQPSAVGIRQDEYGAEFTARASPLLGVAWSKTRESPLGALPTDASRPGTALAATRLGNPPEPAKNPVTGFPNPTEAQAGTGERPRPPTMVYSRILDQVRADAGNLAPRPVTQPGQTEPGGAPGNPQTAPTQPAIDTSIDAQLERLRASMRGEPAPKPPVPTRPDALNPLGKDPAPAAPADGRPGDVTPRETPDGRSPLTPELRRGLKRTGTQKVDSLVDARTRPTPGIDARGGGPIDLVEYNRMMAAGQDLLAQSRFFDAEDRFAMAMRAVNNDPMARVGRLHAQLGAGLFLSAAANLRELLAGNPELVGVRYQPKLLPPAERIGRVAVQLDVELRRSGSVLQRDSALLMAYLGYQTGDKDLLKTGLDEFAANIDPENAADRALLELVQNVWEVQP